MTLLICHPGTGTIIDGDECFVLVLDDDDDTPTEEIEASMDRFYQLVAPEGMTVHTLEGVLNVSIAKHLYEKEVWQG